MSSSSRHLQAPTPLPEAQQQQSSAHLYRGARGNAIVLRETRTGGAYQDGAIEYELKDLEARRSLGLRELAFACLGLALWPVFSYSSLYVVLCLVALGLLLRKALLIDCTHTLLLVESVGVHIINQKTIFGAIEEYLPWNTISDVFINEVISEQKVLYYLTFIVRELTSNGEEQIRLIPLFRDLKPERKCLEYINTSAFTHSKELMKIIRKVIKWRPQQGQHFSTKSLLVTYNDSPWTRQDKMFALMKFTERPDAVPFSHAFTLTVNFLHQDSVETSKAGMGASTSKPKTTIPLECVSNGNSTVTHDLQNSAALEKLTDPPISQLNRSDIKKDQGVLRSLRSRISSKEYNSHQPAPRLPVSSDEIEKLQKHVKNSIIGNDGSIIQDRDEICTDLSTSTEAPSTEPFDENNKRRTVGCNSCDSLDLNALEEELWPQSPEMPDLSSPYHDEYSNDTNSESASLPYQYLIEKDIERELENSRNASRLEKNLSENDTTNSNTVDLNSNDSDRVSSKIPTCRSVLQEESREDSMPPPDIANLRSSDITDLVMKGRMFTIRQDEDMVTVVEQKTKLELDEVLENSEKVETKEGDPCLLNSSLLRLEKMITRMQEPNLSGQKYNGFTDNALLSFMDFATEMNIDDEKRHEAGSIDTAERMESSESNSTIETTNCWTNFFTDRDFSNSTLENFKRILEDSEAYINDENQDDDLELKLDDEDDDDVLPEGMMQYSYDNGVLNSKNETSITPNCGHNSSSDKDKVDVPRTSQVTRSNIDVNRSERVSVTTKTAARDKSSNQPRMISNESIANHQIPSVLLKTLSEKKAISRCNFGTNSTMMENHENQYSINGNIIGLSKVNGIKAGTENFCRNGLEDVSVQVRQNGNTDAEFTTRKLRKRNTDRLTDIDPVNRSEVTLKSSNVGASDKTFSESEIIDSSDLPNRDSMIKLRRTRSNSNMQIKTDESSHWQSLHESQINHTQNVEIKTGDLNVQDSNESLLVNALNTKQTIRQKRRKSVSQDVSKFCKTVSNNGFDKKDVSIDVWKLLSDLENGVEVVIERMNFTNIPR